MPHPANREVQGVTLGEKKKLYPPVVLFHALLFYARKKQILLLTVQEPEVITLTAEWQHCRFQHCFVLPTAFPPLEALTYKTVKQARFVGHSVPLETYSMGLLPLPLNETWACQISRICRWLNATRNLFCAAPSSSALEWNLGRPPDFSVTFR